MKRVDSGNINTLEYRDGGGCKTLFGLPFLFFGLFAVYGAFSGTWKTKSGAPAGFWAPFIFSMVFSAVGLAFVVGRTGTIFDKTVGSVTKWWGVLWFPLYSKKLRFPVCVAWQSITNAASRRTAATRSIPCACAATAATC